MGYKMRINQVKLIRLIDVDITRRSYGKVQVTVQKPFISYQDSDGEVRFELTKKQTTELIRMLKAQRKRIK